VSVQRERLVARAHQQAFEHQVAHLPDRLTADDERVDAVETADQRLAIRTAFRRIRVGIGKMRKVRSQRGLALHCNGVARLGLCRQTQHKRPHSADQKYARSKPS
jgi:hypothetical protein